MLDRHVIIVSEVMIFFLMVHPFKYFFALCFVAMFLNLIQFSSSTYWMLFSTSYEWTIIICVSSREVRVEFLCLQFNCLYFEIMHS